MLDACSIGYMSVRGARWMGWKQLVTRQWPAPVAARWVRCESAVHGDSNPDRHGGRVRDCFIDPIVWS